MARILIVDDEEGGRFTLTRALKDENHEIHLASDGNSALEILASRKIDLVVVDIFMPEREGLQTIVDIQMKWPAVKVIAISGGGRTGNFVFLEVAEMQGASLTLRKPFSMSEFRHAVSSTLGQPLRQEA